MARRPFDPAALGLRKTEYRRGDVLDRDAVDALVAEADVVVHLAFIIMGGREETRRDQPRGLAQRVRGGGRVAGAAAARLHLLGRRLRLPRRQPAAADRGRAGARHDAHYYSAQKAELEETLRGTVAGSPTDAYVFRPCIVAGPDALAHAGGDPVAAPPRAADRAARPGHPASSSSTTTTSPRRSSPPSRGAGEPGVYNLAGPGKLTARDLARELGWTRPGPARRRSRSPPPAPGCRSSRPRRSGSTRSACPVLMDTPRRAASLRWRPRHDAASTLEATVAAARGPAPLRGWIRGFPDAGEGPLTRCCTHLPSPSSPEL